LSQVDDVGFRTSTQPAKIKHLHNLSLRGRNPTTRETGFSFNNELIRRTFDPTAIFIFQKIYSSFNIHCKATKQAETICLMFAVNLPLSFKD